MLTWTLRSTCPEVFSKKAVLRNFPKLTGKHLCWSPFFNKIAGLRPASLLKKRLKHRCFTVNFEKFLKTPFFSEHLWWLLLNFADFFFWRDRDLTNLRNLIDVNGRKFNLNLIELVTFQGNNSIDMIFFYNFHHALLTSFALKTWRDI